VKRLGAVLVTIAVSIACVGTIAPAGAAPDPLSKVTVTGVVGQPPTLEFAKPFKVKQSTSKELLPGSGDKLQKGDKVTFNYVAVNGRTGEQIETSFDKAPATITLDKGKAVAGLVDALVGATVGSRTLLAVAPSEGLAKQLAQNGGPAKKGDTILFVLDVTGVRAPLTKATGTAVPPVAGLPTVKLAKNGKPTITVPKTDAPAQLVVQPLITGTGPVVQAGQTINVHYLGVIWKTGKKFDSSWDRSEAIDFGIGSGEVIAGWDEGLVGQTVGSQVLLVVPPDKGYGEAGQPSAGISATDTLVFVVDILDAY
jgi:peptidylprolyl isomerase